MSKEKEVVAPLSGGQFLRGCASHCGMTGNVRGDPFGTRSRRAWRSSCSYVIIRACTGDNTFNEESGFTILEGAIALVVLGIGVACAISGH